MVYVTLSYNGSCATGSSGGLDYHLRHAATIESKLLPSSPSYSLLATHVKIHVSVLHLSLFIFILENHNIYVQGRIQNFFMIQTKSTKFSSLYFSLTILYRIK